MSLHKSSVLVKLTIRQWDGFKKDRDVSKNVDEIYRTGGEAGNYNKRLLDKSVLAPIQKICNKIRQEHARMTMPWCYDGVSLLPSKLFLDYTALMRELADNVSTEVSNLVDQYPVHIANQASKLGAMFRADDYPEQHELRNRFEVSYNFFPVPQSEHFIVDLETADSEKLKRQLSAELADTQTQALKELYTRVEDLVSHMHTRLSDPGLIFRDSLVTNVESLVKVLPGLNVFNDPTLEEACRRLQDEVLIADAQDLRDDKKLREHVANQAYDVVALLKGERQPLKLAA